MAGSNGGSGLFGKGAGSGNPNRRMGRGNGGNPMRGNNPTSAYHQAAGGYGHRGQNGGGGNGGGGNGGGQGGDGISKTGTINRNVGRGMGFGLLGKIPGWKQAAIIGQALAQSEYGPTIAEDRHTMGINNRQGRAAEALTAGYYQQLGKFTQQGMRAERGIAKNMYGQLGDIGQQTRGALGTIDQNAVNGLRSYTPQGTPGDTTTRAPALNSLASQLAQQKSLSAQDTQAFRQGGAMQGANYRELAAANLGTNSLFGEQQLGQIAQSSRLANEPLIAQIAGLRAKKGALAAADTAKWRQQQIANEMTQQGLHLKDKALQVTAQNDQARNALTARAQNLAAQWHQQEVKLGWANLTERQQNDKATQLWHLMTANKQSAGSGGGVKPLPTTSNNEAIGLLGTAAVAIKAGVSPQQLIAGTGQIKNTAPGATKQHYVALPRINPTIVAAAEELAKYGSITPHTLALLHQMGMYGITYNGSHIKVSSNAATGVRGSTGPQGFTG